MVDEWKNWRGIDSREHVLFMHFLRGEFQGKAEILEQMKSVEVMRINPEGSLRLRSGGPLAEVKDSAILHRERIGSSEPLQCKRVCSGICE